MDSGLKIVVDAGQDFRCKLAAVGCTAPTRATRTATSPPKRRKLGEPQLKDWRVRPGWLPDIPEAPENTNDSSGRGQPTASTLEPKVQRAGESVRAHRGLPADGRHDHRLALDQARRMACTDALVSAQTGLPTSWQGHSSMTKAAGLKRRGCGRPLRGGATRAVCTLQSVCWRYAVPRCVHTCSCLLRAVGDTLGSISHMDAEQLRAAAPGVPIWVREYRQLGANH